MSEYTLELCYYHGRSMLSRSVECFTWGEISHVSAAILLAVTLCAGCASTDPSGDLRPASDWHLSDMHFGRWYQ